MITRAARGARAATRSVRMLRLHELLQPDAGACDAVDREARFEQAEELLGGEVVVLVVVGPDHSLERRQRRAAAAQGAIDVDGVQVPRRAAMGHADDDRAARAQHAVGLCEHALGRGDVLDHVEQQHRVRAAVRERQLGAVGVDHRQPRELAPRPLEQARDRARPPRSPAPRARVRRSPPSRSRRRSRCRARAWRRAPAIAERGPSARRRRAGVADEEPAPAGRARTGRADPRAAVTRGRSRRPPDDRRRFAAPRSAACQLLEQLGCSRRPRRGGQAAREPPGRRRGRTGSSSTSRTAARSALRVQWRGASRIPAPASVTRRALSGLSQFVGTSTIGTPASAAARTVALPPTRDQRRAARKQLAVAEPARDVNVRRQLRLAEHRRRRAALRS